jgi:hypothetical protein
LTLGAALEILRESARFGLRTSGGSDRLPPPTRILHSEIPPLAALVDRCHGVLD